LGERAGRDSELAAEGSEGLAAEDAEDDLRLAPLDRRPLSGRAPSAAALALRARFAAEGVLCRGLFMVSCIVASFPKPVSQETVQRATASREGM
jgi:hypothetical protein